MKLKPLGDRVVVEREEAKETTAGGIVLPDTAKDKPRRARSWPSATGGSPRTASAASCRSRSATRAVHLLRRRGVQDRRRQEGAADARGRHSRRARLIETRFRAFRRNTESHSSLIWECTTDGSQDDRVRSGSPPGDAARDREAGPRGQGDARAARPQRHHPEVVRLADGDQGRRDRRQGNRAGRQVRGHGRQDGQGGRQQDLRRGRRRHDHGDRDGRGDLQRRPQGRRRRRQPHADEAGHGQGGRRHRRAAPQDEHQGHHQDRDRAGRDGGLQLRLRDRQDDRRGHREGRQGRRDHGRGRQDPQDRGRVGRGHAVRPRLPEPLLRHQPDHDGGGARGRLHPDPREEDLGWSRTWCRCWRRSPRPASRS